MRALRIAKAKRWWRGKRGGGWTVAFSRADKSTRERSVINVPKWPRVTDRPSPVTALKRGHLHNHPSHTRTHWRTATHSSAVFVCVCASLFVFICKWNKSISIYLCKELCYSYLSTVQYFHMWHFKEVDTEHWVGWLTIWGHMTSIFQQPCPWGQTVRHKCIINWALFLYVCCSFSSRLWPEHIKSVCCLQCVSYDN